ncbi:MAG: GntR family transcriptional regulator [Thermodesulfobacteriota bacterium]
MTFPVAQNLPEQIAEIIREKIVRLELLPGENIREAQLAAELKVSRSPVREALRLLEKQRLVEQVPRKGTRVTELSEQGIEDLYDVAGALIVLAAEQCAAKSTADELSAINAAVVRAGQAVAKKDVAGYHTAFFEFALHCLKSAKNPLLVDMIMDLLHGVRRMQFLTLSLRSENLEENLEILERGNRYLQNNDGKMAVKTVIEYVAKEKNVAMKTLKQGLHLITGREDPRQGRVRTGASPIYNERPASVAAASDRRKRI